MSVVVTISSASGIIAPIGPEEEGRWALPHGLALDGLQPDVGHEVLWVVRDCLSGEVLLARSLLRAYPKTGEKDLCNELIFQLLEIILESGWEIW
jgi:hypothetical protein